jgi:hypothetical protein
MKYIAVIMIKNEGLYNSILDVEASDLQECVDKSILLFNQESIGGDDANIDSLIDHVVDDFLENSKDNKWSLNNRNDSCFLRDYLDDAEFFIIYVKDGELIKIDAEKYTNNFFTRIEKMAIEKVKKKTKSQRKAEYNKLKKEFDIENKKRICK